MTRRRSACGGLLAVALAAAACTSGGGSTPTTTPTASSPAPSLSGPVQIAFETDGGDTYGWSQGVRVRAQVDCSSVSVAVDGSDAGVTVTGSGRSFRATVPIAYGRNQLVASCTTGPGTVLQSDPVTFVGRIKPAPVAAASVSVSGATITLDGSASQPATLDHSPIASYRWSPTADVPSSDRNPAALTLAAGTRFAAPKAGAKIQLRTPGADGEYYVTLTVKDKAGRPDTSVATFVVEGGVARAVDLAREHPAWIDHTVIYAPIPDLTEQGGPLGVEKQLPYLKKLGVDTLWLWPPTELRAGGDFYTISNYFDLDPQWQPMDAFEHMVRTAHRLGFHVLIDFVPNHMSIDSPMYQDAKKYGKASPYYDFFDRAPDGTFTHYFDWTNLPNLDYDNPLVRKMIIEASVHWVRDLGIDGFRVDAAWGVKRRRPSFWPQWRAALKRVKPDVLLLAEASAVDPYFFSHGFDVAYDWTSQPGQWAWTSVFDFPQAAGALLAPAVTNGSKGYPPGALVMHFINNNDTGIRFVDQHDVATTKVAAALMFTLPGVPEMFAGDEIGAGYVPYSTLAPIDWKDEHHLRPTYETLIHLKRTMPTLASLEMEPLQTSPDAAYAYVRPAFGGGPPVLVVLNFGKATKVSFPLTSGVASVIGSGRAKDLLGGAAPTIARSGTSVSLSVKGTTALVLVPAGS